ncbi:MAG: hypothetical protein AB8B55_16650 [Mariniblastus sp.]
MTNFNQVNPLRAIAIACLAFFTWSCSEAAQAQEFKIESSVYTADESLPISQNVTLFSEGLVYEFLMSNEAQPRPLEIVIFDSRTLNMVLLDTQKQIRLELPELRVTKILEGVRRATIQDNRSSFLVEEVYEEDTDLSTGWLTMTSPTISYRLKGERAKNAAMIPLYMNFLNHFTRLKATDPNQIPPFPRMKLNQAIQRLGWMPSEVQFTAKQNSLFRQAISAKSKHILFEQLSRKDKEEIAKAKRHWMNFKAVEFGEYRGLPEQPKIRIPKIRTASFEEDVDNATQSATQSATKNRK